MIVLACMQVESSSDSTCMQQLHRSDVIVKTATKQNGRPVEYSILRVERIYLHITETSDDIKAFLSFFSHGKHPVAGPLVCVKDNGKV